MNFALQLLVSSVLVFVPSLCVGAESPRGDKADPIQLMTRMKASLEPPRPSLRRVEIVVRSRGDYEDSWQAREARRHTARGNSIVMVMLEPSSIRGTAFLIDEQPNGFDVQWVYLPTTRRVRKLVNVSTFQPFLGTDFTFADLGFIHLDSGKLRGLGPDLVDGNAVQKVEERLKDNWYYGRIVNYIDVDSLLPVRRDIYTPGDVLWKRQSYESVVVIDDIPTPTEIRMEDVRENESTTLRITSVEYDAKVPDEIFDPANLPTLVDHPIWK